MIELGSLDRVTAVIGERGMGKSTFCRLDMADFAFETGGYVVGHSPNGQIGRHERIRFYERLDGWFGLHRGVRRRPGDWHFMTTGGAEPILDIADAIALGARKAAHAREHRRFRAHRPPPDGLKAPPVLAVIDEGTSMRRNPTQEEIAGLERLLCNARHKHLALTWSTQAPTARQWVLLEQASRLRIFRYTHQYGLTSLLAAGVPRDVVGELPHLPRFTYFSMDKADGDGGQFQSLPPP